MPVVTLGQNSLLNWLKDTGKQIVGETFADKDVKTQAIVIMVETLTGSKPIIDQSNPNVNVIKFTKEQRKKLESLFDSKKTSTDEKGLSKPSNVKIEHTSLWLPLAIKKSIPYAITIFGIGLLIGRVTK